MFIYLKDKRLRSLLLLLTLMLFGAACSSRSEITKNYIESYSSENIVYLNSENFNKSEVKWTTENPPSMEEVKRAVKAGEASEKLAMMGDWWLYGPGMGYTMLNLGTVVLFPPYALYLLGNAALSISGSEPVRVMDIVPEGDSRAAIEGALDDVCSVPGRLNAAIAGKSYVDSLSIHNE